MDPVADLHALVPHDRAAACERSLRQRVPGRDLAIRDAPPGRYVVRDDRLYDDVTAARTGGAVGGIVGLLLAAVGVGTGVLAGAPVGLFLGAGAIFAGGIGAVIGLQRHEILDDDPVSTMDVAAGDWVLVSVHTAHWDASAHRRLARHGARLVEQDVPQPLPG